MKLLLGLSILGFLGLTYCCEGPGDGAVNVALNGEATQSSDLGYGMGYAPRAIDGNCDADYYAGSCAHTKAEINPWWKVNLKNKYIVSHVVITNRKDCCSERIKGAEVRVGNSPNVNENPVCGTIVNTVAGANTTLCCNGMEGRYVGVTITSRPDYITLCEVQVFGKQKLCPCE